MERFGPTLSVLVCSVKITTLLLLVTPVVLYEQARFIALVSVPDKILVLEPGRQSLKH